MKIALWLMAAAFSLFIAPSNAAEDGTRYFTSGGKKIALETFPAASAQAPVVLVLHGSSGIELGNRFIAGIAADFARRGFTTHLLHYFDRTGTSYADDRAIKRHSAEWLETIHDGIDFLEKEQPGRKLGVFGYSLGAYLALNEASRNPRIAAVVELAGGFQGSAPTRFPPVLILHGDRDTRVPFSEARALEALFKKTGTSYEIHVYSGEGHILQLPSFVDVVNRGAGFFNQHLQK